MLGLGLGLVALYRFTSLGLLVDDAFITFRYADHLAGGLGLTYNEGERVEGISSLLWTLLLAGSSALGVPPELSAPIVGCLFGLGTVIALAALAHGSFNCGPIAVVTASACVLLNTSFGFWAPSGMETALFAALVVAGCALGTSSRVESRKGAVWLGIVGGALAATRPEGWALVGLVPLCLWARRVKRDVFWWGMGTAGGLSLVQLVFRILYYGALVPNTYHAKVGLTAPALARGFDYVASFLVDEGVLWLLPLVVFARFRRRGRLAIGLVVMVLTAMVVSVGGDGLYRYRLMVPALPLIAVLAADGLDRLFCHRKRWGWVGLSFVVCSAVVPLLDDDFFRGHSLAEVSGWEQRWDDVGRALARTIPRDAVLATNVAGRVPYRSELATIDLLGLTDPVIARQQVGGLGTGYAGHERASPKYVLARHPDLLYISVLDGMPAELFCNRAAVQSALSSGSLFRYATLLDEANLPQSYVPAELEIGPSSRAGLFVARTRTKELSGRPGITLGTWCGRIRPPDR